MKMWVIVFAVVIATATGFESANSDLSSHAKDASIVTGEVAESADELLTSIDSGFHGVVLIAKHGRIILHKGYGWIDREQTRRTTTTTPFWIASVTKQFAAAAILKLMEQERLSLSDSIAKVFPNVPIEKRPITIHQLLTHTAGLRDEDAADGIIEHEAAVAAILATPLAGKPGEQFVYTNDAYNLIAAIIEIVAQKPYETYLREQLLKPAGLTHTGFWGPNDHLDVADILHMRSLDSSLVSPNWGYRGARGMYSTSHDLYEWYVALNKHRVLSAASVNQLFRTHVQNNSTGVGYGWFASQTSRNTKAIWTRGLQGFGHGALLAAYLEEDTVLVITSNSDKYSPGIPMMHKLAADLSELIFPAR